MNEKNIYDDIINVNAIEFVGYHGILPDESISGRRYKVNVSIKTSFEKASNSDQILDTIDYRDICKIIIFQGTSKKYNLIESLAVAIANDILSSTNAKECIVNVEKFATDLVANSVSVTITRSKQYSTD